jgi:hypothetical protein
MAKVLNDKRIGGFTDILKFVKGELNFEILSKIEEVIAGTAGPTDTVLVYFSGHGKLDQLGRLYLAVKGTKKTSLDASSIAIDRLISYVDRSRCKAILLILDCCYSGAVRGVFRKSGVDDAFASATHGRGIHLMTSSTDAQQSHEKEGEKNSIFTKFLLEGLQTGEADLNNDGVISVDEAYTYTYNCVKGTGLQNPMKFNLDVRGDLVLGKNIQYRPVEQPDAGLVPEDQYAKFFAVKTMIDMLNSNEPPIFFVMLFKYYIEGEMYRASGLTISSGHTPNIRQTQTGFECDAFFEPHMLTPGGRKGKETVNRVMKVRMKVMYEDIMIITGKTREGRGTQINLFGS